MYSRRIVNKSLSHWASQPGNFEPEEHTVFECQRAIDHLNSIHIFDEDPEAFLPVIPRRALASMDEQHARKENWKNWLAPDEIKWIRNERILCACDFSYWLKRYALIKSEEEQTVRMTLWASQEIFMDIVAEMQDWEIAIFLIILKARQLGLSRIISLILLHRVIFHADVNAFMASSTEQKTGLLFDMSDFVLTRLPFWMRPSEKFRREGKLLELHNGSGVTLQHGQQSTGIARGTSPTVAHISELAEFTNAKALIDAALMRAMHPSVKSFLALEGTAEGMNNWWHKKWNSTKAEWPLRRSRLRPLFLPWFVGGLYPKEIDLRARPVPADYSTSMLPWAENHAKMAREYVLKTDYLLKRLGSNWHMPIEQIWYYECERESAIRESRLNDFLGEMPANDDEAFQSKNISVFDTDTITYYRDNAHVQELVGCYGLKCAQENIIPPRLWPSELSIDYSKDSIFVDADCGGDLVINFEFVPLKFNGWSLEEDSEKGSIDKIYIWELPVPGETYGFGCDTADGIDKDRTVVQGLRKGSINGPTKQVVEFASGKMSAIDAWPFLLAIGTLYTTQDSSGNFQQPRMAIECKGHGDMPQNIIRMMGWHNFHPWNDKNIDSRKLELHKYNKIGVFTNEWFRSGMIEMIIKMLRDGEIEICSPFFVREMQALEGDEAVQSLRAGFGGHDDRIMALGFILISLYRWDAEHYRSAKVAAYSGKSISDKPRAAKQYARWAYSEAERNDSGIYMPVQ